MTVGIHPKVALPALILAVVGAALIAVGAIVGDGQVSAYGAAVLAASGVTAGAGYAAPAGSVEPPQPVPSDDQLSDTATARLKDSQAP